MTLILVQNSFEVQFIQRLVFRNIVWFGFHVFNTATTLTPGLDYIGMQLYK